MGSLKKVTCGFMHQRQMAKLTEFNTFKDIFPHCSPDKDNYFKLFYSGVTYHVISSADLCLAIAMQRWQCLIYKGIMETLI